MSKPLNVHVCVNIQTFFAITSHLNKRLNVGKVKHFTDVSDNIDGAKRGIASLSVMYRFSQELEHRTSHIHTTI